MDDGGALPPEFVRSVLAALNDDDDARSDFVEGLGKHLHYLSLAPQDPRVIEDLLRFARRWAMSAMLGVHPVRRAVLEDSERRIAAGDLGEPATTAELRSLIRG